MEFKINSDSETAFSYLRWLVNSLEWYRRNNYPADIFPEGKLLEEMQQSVQKGESEDIFTQKFFKQATAEFYNEDFFQKMHALIDSKIPCIAKICADFSKLEKNWGFKVFDTYQLDLTYGGSGGSYNPCKGKVILRMPKQPDFQQMATKNWERLIVHEMLHIGIEENIVKAFNLSQNEKERVVDLMTRYFTKDPYMQERGEKRMDAFVTEEAIVHNLVEAVQKGKKSLSQNNLIAQCQNHRWPR